MKKIISFMLVLALLALSVLNASAMEGAEPAGEGQMAITAIPGPSFSDVAGHWAASAISEWTAKGVLKGYPDGTFRPAGNVTLAELATMLCRVKDIPPAGGAECAGLKLSDWYYPSVSGMLAQRMLPVHSSYTETLTREDAAYMIGRAFGLESSSIGTASVSYADLNSCSGYALDMVKKMAAAGIINGYPDGSFRPKNSITRAEAVTLLSRAQSAADSGRINGQPAITSGAAIASDWNKTLDRMWVAMDAMAALEEGGTAVSVSFRSGEEAAAAAKELLKTRWGIADEAALKSKLEALKNDSEDARFKMSVLELSQYDSARLAALKSSSFMYEETLELYDKWASKGICAYDALQTARLAMLGFNAGYLDYGDASYVAGTVPQSTLKKQFGSWAEVWDNYLDGASWVQRRDIRGGKARTNEGMFQSTAVFWPDVFDNSLLK